MVAELLVALVLGTPGPDVLLGSDRRDVLHAWGGDDRVAGLAGGDWIDGGLGDDVLFAGGGPDVVHGGPGDDRLIGGADLDHLFAGAGDDVVDAREPPVRRTTKDCDPCDPIPPGAEYVRAGSGDDRVLTRDGRVDAVTCGPGRDVLVADRRDVLVRSGGPAGCEVVLRR